MIQKPTPNGRGRPPCLPEHRMQMAHMAGRHRGLPLHEGIAPSVVPSSGRMPNSFSSVLRKRKSRVNGNYTLSRRQNKGVLLIGWSNRACLQCKRSTSLYPTEHASFPNRARLCIEWSIALYRTEHSSTPNLHIDSNNNIVDMKPCILSPLRSESVSYVAER